MKKYIILPVVLLIYLGVIAYFSYPSPENGKSFVQYYITIAISVIVCIALGYFLKKKEEKEKANKNKK
ncbi:hypothetical protein LJC06_03495 [Bacteroidales bacterium OttesenSCG-928-I14]|nr:hypothetical protein [Bacteroidales bacterium OttesenSCG-928-I14]